MALIEKDKTSFLMTKIKEHGLDRLRGIFNKLSPTQESHQLALKSLMEKILLSKNEDNLISQNPMTANAYPPSFFFRYTLYKILVNILKDAQEEFFNHIDEAQPYRLARISTLLCMECGSAFSDLLRGQFFLVCPLIMPKITGEDCNEDELFFSLGFNRRFKNNNLQVRFFISLF